MKQSIDIDALRSADRKSLARSITLLESTRDDHRRQAEALIQRILPFSGHAVRIGLTGVPGAGKSSLIEVLGNYVIAQGHRIAVLAVDPSSTLTGGSILGDKTRMPTLATNPDAFIRPTPAGGTPGGVARRTRESILLCEAAGFDVVVVETVGTGQSETLVSQMTDVFLLMLLPGGGDELQGIKRGVMELADIVVVNKADGELKSRASLSAAEIRQALRLIRPTIDEWEVPVIPASVTGKINIDRIWDSIQDYCGLLNRTGHLEARRKAQLKAGLWSEVREMLLGSLMNDAAIEKSIEGMQEKVCQGEMSPSDAARQLVSLFLKEHHAPPRSSRGQALEGKSHSGKSISSRAISSTYHSPLEGESNPQTGFGGGNK